MASLEPTFDNHLAVKKALESDQRLENGFHTSIYHVYTIQTTAVDSFGSGGRMVAEAIVQ
eukprot:scaffold37691_cov184-Skeletonema_marinoi.AAC.1